MTTITNEMGLAGITTQPLTTNPFKSPQDDIPNLIEKITPCYYPPFEGTGTSSSTPYSWEIPPDSQHYTSKVLWLTGRYRASKVNAAGERVAWTVNTETNKVNEPGIWPNFGLIDDIGQRMWKKITLHINGIPLQDPSSQPYPYRALFEIMTGIDPPPKKNMLPQLMNHLRDEVAEGYDIEGITTEASTRFKKIAHNDWSEFCIPIHSDLMSLKQHLPPNNSIRVTAERWEDKFLFETRLTTNQKVTLELSNVELCVYKIQSNTTIEKGGRKPITLTRFKDIPRKVGDTDLSVRNLFRGEILPQQVVVCLEDTDAFVGDWKKSPFKFEKETISEAALIVDGVFVEPQRPLTNIRNGVKGWGDLEMYKHVHTALGYDYQHRSRIIDLSYAEWSTDSFFLAFDRSRAQNNSFSMSSEPLPGQYLDLRYVLASDSKLKVAKTLLVMGIYKTFMEFNSDGSLKYVPHITT